MPKRLGQHFLKDAAALKKIAAALDAGKGETIIEIGSGHGELTAEIQNAKVKSQNCDSEIKIIGIEKDRRLAEKLRQKFAEDENIEIIEGDALKILPEVVKNYKLKPKSYKLAGNIPYYITGRLLRVIGELEYKPERCVFTLQKEVAERLVSGEQRINPVRSQKSSVSAEMRKSASRTSNGVNRLAASVQFWAEPEIIAALPKTCFRPAPQVDSAVVVLKTKDAYPGIKPDNYYRMVKVLFRQPRKTLLNNFRAAGFDREAATRNLKRAGLDPDLRPQDLGVEDIARIAREIDSLA